MPTISIGFQIQNKGNGFQELILDADKFKNLLTQTVTEAKKLDDKSKQGKKSNQIEKSLKKCRNQKFLLILQSNR